jgi:Tfp pilus assembly protein PilF
VVAYQQKNLSQAESSWKEALRLDPKDARSHNNLGVLRSSAGKHVEALVSFQTASKMKPENSRYLLNEGYENLSLGRVETARKIFERIQKRPDVPHEVGFLATALMAKIDGKWSNVLSFCERSIKLDADYTQALVLRAEALEKLQKLDEAREAYQKALESDPNLVEVEKSLARLKPVPPSPSPSPSNVEP